VKNSLLFHTKKEGRINASILYEVPRQEGNEGCQGDNHEEWKAGNTGRVPCMWDQDVQNWEELKLILRESDC